jgi:hypothetical protein
MTKQKRKVQIIHQEKIKEADTLNIKSKKQINYKSVLNYTAIIMSIISGGYVIFLVYTAIRETYKPQSEKNIEDKFWHGDLKPPKLENTPKQYTVSELPPIYLKHPIISNLQPGIKGLYAKGINKKNNISIVLGNLMINCLVSDLYKGVNLFSPSFTNCTDSKLIIGLKDDRLYVSVEFKDLEKEETIGVIEFNHWLLYKDNTLRFNNDDERLEVKDKQNNIVFSIQYVIAPPNDPIIQINGYFINPYDVLIISDMAVADSNGVEFNKCILKKDLNWKQKAEFKIQNIKSIF